MDRCSVVLLGRFPYFLRTFAGGEAIRIRNELATQEFDVGANRGSDILPLPEPRFKGRIGSTFADSEADVIALPTAPPGAPNVLLVLLDDVGFGQASTFGGPV